MSEEMSRAEAVAAVDHELHAAVGPLALMAGMELDVFSALADGPRTAAEVAARIGVAERRLSELLYALAVTGWLTQEDGRFANGPVAARALVRDAPGGVLGAQRLSLDLTESLLHTAQSIRAGAPAVKHDFARMERAELERFFEGLHPMTLTQGASLAARGELDGVRQVLDVGGGSGGISIAACGALPELRATVTELPSVAPIARDHVARAGLAERVNVIDHDAVTTPLPGGHDAAVLRSFLQVLSAADCRRVLKHVAAALEPGGKLIVMTRALDDDRMGPKSTVLFNLAFANIYDEGRAWTEREHREWMEEAGFEEVEREVLGTGQSVFRARAMARERRL